MIRFFVNTVYPEVQGNWMGLMGFGIMSLLIGVLIVLVPEILVAFIASIFLIAGILAIYTAWKLRRMWSRRQKIRINIHES